MKRLCQTCGLGRKELQGTRRRVCDSCQRKARRVSARTRHVTRTYGLSVAQHAVLLRYQDGRCAICRQTRPYNLAVDHDHKTGLVRGACCKRCNKLLRDVRDDQALLLAAALYLKCPPAQMLGIEAKAEQ